MRDRGQKTETGRTCGAGDRDCFPSSLAKSSSPFSFFFSFSLSTFHFPLMLISNQRLILDTPRIMRDPLGYLTALTQEVGERVVFDVGDYKAVVLNDAEAIERVLIKNARNYSKQTIQYQTLAQVTGEGLLVSDGEFWLRQRRMAQPAFHRKKLEGLGRDMVAVAQTIGLEWQNAMGIRDVEEDMFAISLRTIFHALFSLDIGETAGEIVEAVNATLDYVIFRARMPFPWIAEMPLSVVERYKVGKGRLDSLIEEEVRSRESGVGSRGDILAQLLDAGMRGEVLRDEIVTLIVAGYDTVASGLTWAWFLLDRYPTVGVRLREELRAVLDGRPPTVDDLPNLPYLEAVCNEVWRLYPPAWVMTRSATQDDQIGEVKLEKGSLVIICPFAVHRNKRYWDEPEHFEPERFIGENSRPKMSFIPFGGGGRLCIGDHFARLETQLVLGTLAQRFRPVRVSDDPMKINAVVTTRPRGGLPMRIEKRESSAISDRALGA